MIVKENTELMDIYRFTVKCDICGREFSFTDEDKSASPNNTSVGWDSAQRRGWIRVFTKCDEAATGGRYIHICPECGKDDALIKSKYNIWGR